MIARTCDTSSMCVVRHVDLEAAHVAAMAPVCPRPHRLTPLAFDLQLEEAERKRLESVKLTERNRADEAMEKLAQAEAKAAAQAKTVPPVRAPAKIAVSFSKRAFSTPERESYKAEEEEVRVVWAEAERATLSRLAAGHQHTRLSPFPTLYSQWLAKQATARKAVNEAKASKPGDVEHDPLWYRDKGGAEGLAARAVVDL